MTELSDQKQKKPRGSGRRWKKGESGNPAGRPKGVGPAAELRKAIGEDIPVILAKLVELAKGGDVQAARTLLGKVVPDLRAESMPVLMPGADNGTLSERAQAALEAAGRGEVAPDTAAHLVAALASLARIREVDELERRISALETQNGTD